MTATAASNHSRASTVRRCRLPGGAQAASCLRRVARGEEAVRREVEVEAEEEVLVPG